MANDGNGVFLDVYEQQQCGGSGGGNAGAGNSGNDTININSLLGITVPTRWALRQFQVWNLNSAMCDDGTIDVDSDSDGICDKDELAYNQKFAAQLQAAGTQFDPTNRNSLNNYYSDFFMKQIVLAGGGNLPSCTTGLTDTDGDLLTDCEEQMLENQTPTALTSDWTNLLVQNGGHGDPLNPDTDGDGFIDSISLFGFGSLSSPVNFINSLSTFAPGITGSDIIHQHLNYRAPNANPNSSYDIQLTPIGYNQLGENCYSYSQTKLQLFPTLAVTDVDKVTGFQQLTHQANENVILVYYLAVPENDPNTRQATYRYSYQKLQYQPGVEQTGADLDFSQFQIYKVPNP